MAKLMKDKLTGEPVAVKFIERGEKVCGVPFFFGNGEVMSKDVM